jgi:hypothetical protein
MRGEAVVVYLKIWFQLSPERIDETTSCAVILFTSF